MKKFPKPWYRPSRGVWYVTLDGRQHNLGPDRDAAFDHYRELLSSKPKGRADSVSVASLIAIIDVFLDWVQKHRSADTFEWYRYRLERLARRYPDLRVDELKPFHVQQWVDEYDFSVTSRRNYLRSIKRCLRWAVRQGYLDRNPIAALEVPAAEHREIVISEDEFASILSVVPDEAFRELLVTTWESGCRPQESLRVEARHVDLANRRWVFATSESKNRRLSRIVYLTDPAFAITERRIRQFPSGKLFRNSSGRPWATSAVNCAFRRVRERLGRQIMKEQTLELDEQEIRQFMLTLKTDRTVKGKRRAKTEGELLGEARRKLLRRMACSLVPNYSLYALRHSWATHALQRGVDPLTTAILMGHKDPSMLARVYQHLSHNPEHLLQQAKKAVS